MYRSKDLYVKVHFHYERIPKIMQNHVGKAFMENRSEVVQIFNELIDAVNKEWDITGKPCAFGEYLQDINPEYANFIRKKIQPSIDSINKRFILCRYKIDKYGALVGYVPFIRRSRIWIGLEIL